MRSKIPALVEALTGRFTEHHAFLIRLHLDQIDRLTATLHALAARIEAQIAPFRTVIELLTTIPGIDRRVAEVIIAETGGDMTVFPSADHLASWAGVSPGHRESAGKNKSGKTRPGNSYLKGALDIAAFGAASTSGSWLQARYRRLSTRRGPLRALVAIEHSILVATWHMLTNQVPYTDLGGDYYTRQNPDRATRRAVGILEALGYTVTLDRPDPEPAA